ncbi:hypothetical protein HUU05_04515 [candidate division KSB1 bacterium]|nr:hypothetical protein [candidate division KSB1 bacterium]
MKKSFSRHAQNIYLLAMMLPAALFIWSTQAHSQADVYGGLPTQQLSELKYTLALDEGVLKGSGADFLLSEAKAAQFFLIGEDHGIAEVPQFTAALFQQMNPMGYHHFAIETGPLTAQLLTRLASEPNAQAAFSAFHKENPFAVPFYNWQEEAALLLAVLNASKPGAQPLWGLDQEFIMSSKLHFKKLLALAPNDDARKVVNEFYEKTQTEFNRMVESKNPGLVFLASAQKADFEKLENAFGPQQPLEAKEILFELKTSWEIYAKNFSGAGYESNAQRAGLMKKHFMSYYQQALAQEGNPPRVLFKFGVYHIKKGRSYTNVYDIGNLAAELAQANNSRSFHLFVLGAAGTQNAYLPFVGNEADKNKKIDAVATYDFADIKPFMAAADLKLWTVFDLRPLRPLLHAQKLGSLAPNTKELIWGYDAVLVMPQVRAATLFD